MKHLFVVLSIAMTTMLAPLGASAQSGNVYNASQLSGNVEEATVIQTRIVDVEEVGWQERSAGTALGGALGAVIANAMGSNRSTAARAVLASLGAAAGGLAGNRLANTLARAQAQEIILRFPNGRLQVVVQPMPAQNVEAGESVLVLQQNRQTRIIRLGGQPMVQQQLRPEPTLVRYERQDQYLPHGDF